MVREFLSERRSAWARRVNLNVQIPEAAFSMTDHDALLDLRAALAAVPPRQRATLVLRFSCDLNVEQTARVLGCSAGTVKSQTAKGLAALRRSLGPQDAARPATGVAKGRPTMDEPQVRVLFEHLSDSEAPPSQVEHRPGPAERPPEAEAPPGGHLRHPVGSRRRAGLVRRGACSVTWWHGQHQGSRPCLLLRSRPPWPASTRSSHSPRSAGCPPGTRWSRARPHRSVSSSTPGPANGHAWSVTAISAGRCDLSQRAGPSPVAARRPAGAPVRPGPGRHGSLHGQATGAVGERAPRLPGRPATGLGICAATAGPSCGNLTRRRTWASW